MAIGCGPKVGKYILLVFNALFWISGLILIIAGAVFLANGSLKYIDQIISSSTNRNILILFIIVGVIIFAIAFCGCCGALKESRCLLGTYIIFIFIIIVAEVVFGIFVIVNKSTVEQEFTKSYNDTLMNKYGNRMENGTVDPTVMTTIDNLNQIFRCCGVNTYKDWQQSAWYKYRADPLQTVPQSCCAEKDVKCWQTLNEDNTFTRGCVKQMVGYIKNNLPIVIGVALGIAFFEVFVVICAFCLCRNTGTQRQAV